MISPARTLLTLFRNAQDAVRVVSGRVIVDQHVRHRLRDGGAPAARKIAAVISCKTSFVSVGMVSSSLPIGLS